MLGPCNVEARGWDPFVGLATETRMALPFTDHSVLPSTIQFAGNRRLLHAPHSAGMLILEYALACRAKHVGWKRESSTVAGREHRAETHTPRISTSRLRVADRLPIKRSPRRSARQLEYRFFGRIWNEI